MANTKTSKGDIAKGGTPKLVLEPCAMGMSRGPTTADEWVLYCRSWLKLFSPRSCRPFDKRGLQQVVS